jgi:hypothetical protein
MGMEAFYTRDKANDGVRVDLFTPDGVKSGEWLMVRHVWSDAFADAEEAAKLRVAGKLRDELQRSGLKGEDEIPPEVRAVIKAEGREARLDLLAALVSGWSFDSDCTPEAVRAFLHNAPQIAEQVDKIAGDTRRFFGNGSTSSKRGSAKKKN